MVVPKKNGKLRVCVNLKKLNAATIRDNYPLPITDHVLERVAGKQAYHFWMDFPAIINWESQWRTNTKRHLPHNGKFMLTG